MKKSKSNKHWMVVQTFKMTNEHKRELDNYAKRFKLSKGSIIRNALRYYIRTVFTNVSPNENDFVNILPLHEDAKTKKEDYRTKI